LVGGDLETLRATMAATRPAVRYEPQRTPAGKA
jgi:hypothetical protein